MLTLESPAYALMHDVGMVAPEIKEQTHTSHYSQSRPMHSKDALDTIDDSQLTCFYISGSATLILGDVTIPLKFTDILRGEGMAFPDRQ